MPVIDLVKLHSRFQILSTSKCKMQSENNHQFIQMICKINIGGLLFESRVNFKSVCQVD